MQEDVERFRQAGVELVAIGMGSPGLIRQLRARMGLPFALLSDQQLAAYRAYHLLRMKGWREVNLTTATRYAGRILRHGVGLSPGEDRHQLGGAFVVDREGTVRYAFRAQRSAELPAHDELLAVAAHL